MTSDDAFIRHQPDIRTPRLLLRKIQPQDAEDVFSYCRIPFVRQHSTRSPMVSLSESSAFLAERTQGPNMLNYAITVLVRDTLSQLAPITAPIAKRTLLPIPADADSTTPPAGHRYRVVGLVGSKAFPEIGYVLDPAVYGQAVATEALRAILPALWDAMPSGGAQGWDFIIARVDTENGASMRVLEKNGFVRGEVTRAEFLSPQLGTRDSVAFWLPRPGCEGRVGELMRVDPKFTS